VKLPLKLSGIMICSALSVAAHAVTDGSSSTDLLLQQIEAHADKAKRSVKHSNVVKAIANKTKTSALPTNTVKTYNRQIVASNKDAVKVSPAQKPELIDNSVVEIQEVDIEALPEIELSQIPKGTRLSMKSSVFFPANRGAMVYVNGTYSHSVIEGKGPIEIFADESLSDNALSCVLTSTKSYLLLRGLDRPEKLPSFLDVGSVKLFSGVINTKPRLAFSIDFETKKARGKDILFGITCVLPSNKTSESDLGKLKMTVIESGFKGLFNFSLPNYTEV
jgi:hypothetical protein